jgi:5-methylcytosine-specific restriction enzyme subunit McrC
VKVDRLSVTEYRWEDGLVASAAARTGLSPADVRALLESAGQRLRNDLAVDFPIEIKGDNVKITQVAGVIRLAPRLELEVAPKFLGKDWDAWREDFFVIAALSRFGRVLPREDILASTAAKRDLATLLGHIFAREYWRHHRRPLRLYRHRRWQSFAVDGDLDPEATVLPDSDGFMQSGPVFDRDNGYMQTIHAAVGVLISEVGAGQIRHQLERVHSVTRPSSAVLRPHAVPFRLPNRHRRWQTLYDLSRDVLRGFGAGYTQADKLFAPGFVLKTNDTWEHVVIQALRSGFPTATVRKQKYVLGTRDDRPVGVTPDVSIEGLTPPLILVDAKYGARADKTVVTASGDLYEALAFAEAAGVERVLLAYPRPAGEPAVAIGVTELSDRVEVDGREVRALTVECRGISRRGAFASFARRFTGAVLTHAK